MSDVFILKVVNHFTLHLFNNWKWTKNELKFNYELIKSGLEAN